MSLTSLDIGSGGATTTAITNIDAAINSVSSLRGTLGANPLPVALWHEPSRELKMAAA